MITPTTATDHLHFMDWARKGPHPLTARFVEIPRDTGLLGPPESYLIDLLEREKAGAIVIDRAGGTWTASY